MRRTNFGERSITHLASATTNAYFLALVVSRTHTYFAWWLKLIFGTKELDERMDDVCTPVALATANAVGRAYT